MRLPLTCALVVLSALVGAQAAAADPFGPWSGTRGQFAWEAKPLSCGVERGDASRLRAHTRWAKNPGNGYQRLTFERQLREDATGTWTTVQRQRRSTKNTSLEGARVILHWWQHFFPLQGDGGRTSRHVVTFAWLRDRAGRDRLILSRSLRLKPCVVGG